MNVVMTKKDRELLGKLHRLVGSDNAKEAEAARKKLVELLKRYGLTWNNLPELLREEIVAAESTTREQERRASAAGVSPADFGGHKIPNALELTQHLLEQYLDLKPHEYVAMALWVLHTHVYTQFPVTPRLALMSPSNGCGKTTVLGALNRLTREPKQTAHITPAALFRVISEFSPTMLLDEGDNLGLLNNPTLRSIMNSGHEKSSSTVTRTIAGYAQDFETFGPMAVAAIGTLPVPLVKRSIIVRMERSDRSDLKRLGNNDQAIFDMAWRMIRDWASDVKLNLDPPMPKGIRNRVADNWRVLLAIADTFGPDFAERARDAALVFSRSYTDEDVAILLLDDCRAVFNERAVDRISSADLTAAVVERDGNWSWSTYQGPHDDQAPRKLSQGELARLLRPFQIRTRKLRINGGPSIWGYYREMFEKAWSRYCPQDGTPEHSKPVRLLKVS